MTVSGLNFNSNDRTATTSLELAGSGWQVQAVACSSTSWTSGTMVLCGAASYRGGTAQIGVTTSEAVATGGAGSFSFDGAHAANASAGRTRRIVACLCSPGSDRRLAVQHGSERRREFCDGLGAEL